jgi:sugar phosphate isomerase/epimerase
MTADRSRIWADVLRSLSESGQPAYVEIDPETSAITQLLLPIPYRVQRIAPARDGLEVELVISHARHYLRKSNPRFEELRKALEAARAAQAPVLVTETLNEHEIIDVRPAAREGGAVKE